MGLGGVAGRWQFQVPGAMMGWVLARGVDTPFQECVGPGAEIWGPRCHLARVAVSPGSECVHRGQGRKL